MKITQNPHKIAITEEMIPIVVGNDEIRMVKVTVDQYSAGCFLMDRVWYSTKIVIVFDEPHPRWNEYFTTKYFRFDEPGRMLWGHEGECMNMEAILLTVEEG